MGCNTWLGGITENRVSFSGHSYKLRSCRTTCTERQIQINVIVLSRHFHTEDHAHVLWFSTLNSSMSSSSHLTTARYFLVRTCFIRYFELNLSWCSFEKVRNKPWIYKLNQMCGWLLHCSYNYYTCTSQLSSHFIRRQNFLHTLLHCLTLGKTYRYGVTTYI